MARTLIESIKEWRKDRHYSKVQLDYIRGMLESDARWFAHDKTASELIKRYIAATDVKWYTFSFEDACSFRNRILPDYIKNKVRKTD